MLVFRRRLTIGRGELDGELNLHLPAPVEDQGYRNFLPDSLRLFQSDQHEMIAAGREGDLTAGRDRHAGVEATHGHDAASH